MQLRKSIDTYSNLPIINNFAGDVRKVIDTGVIYIWISQASSDVIAKWCPFDLAVSGSAVWGAISGDIADQTDLIAKIEEMGFDDVLNGGEASSIYNKLKEIAYSAIYKGGNASDIFIASQKVDGGGA